MSLWTRFWRWLLRGVRGPDPTPPNRAARRALERVSRLPRAEVDRLARDLRPLSPADRDRVLDLVPEWHAAQIRKALGRRR